MRTSILNKNTFPAYTHPCKPFTNLFIDTEANYVPNSFFTIYTSNTNRYSDNTIPVTAVENDDKKITTLSMAAAESSLQKEWENEDSDYWLSYPNIK